jgi:hypothetical protein
VSARRRSDAVGFVVVRCSMVIDKPECVTMFDDVSDAQQRLSLKRGRVNRVKMPLFIAGFIASAFLTLSATSHAAPPGGGFHGGRFRSGFVAHSAGPAFRMGSGIRRNFAFHQNRRFFHRDHRLFFQQFAWPVYWYPYYPYDYSYLDYGPDNDYQYWDNSAASVQRESFRPAVDHGPVVVIVNTGNSRPMDSRDVLQVCSRGEGLGR